MFKYKLFIIAVLLCAAVLITKQEPIKDPWFYYEYKD